jgi:hypothetical protein
VVLSSGGVRGVYAHTGFLLALEDLGIPIAAAVVAAPGGGGGGRCGRERWRFARLIGGLARASY